MLTVNLIKFGKTLVILSKKKLIENLHIIKESQKVEKKINIEEDFIAFVNE